MGVRGVTQTHLPSEKGSDTYSDTRVTPPTLGVTVAVTPPGGASLECHRSKSGPLTSEGGMEVTPVTPVTPPSTISHVEQVGADLSPDPEDVFRGRPSRADRARASGRWSDPSSDGDSSPPTEPSSIDPPSVAPPLPGAVPPDPARLEAATRDLTDLLRSTGTVGRDLIRNVLGASGYSDSEISAAVGSVCGAGLVRQDPGGVLRWKEVSA